MGWSTVIVSDDTFEDEVLRADRPVLVDFWAAWWVPCRLIAPILETIAEEQANNLVVAKLNVDENPGVVDKYRIHAIPVQGVFSDGEWVTSIRGARTKSAILRRLGQFVPLTCHAD